MEIGVILSMCERRVILQEHNMRYPAMWLFMITVALCASGCTQVAGEVVDPRGRPHTSAVFSIGHPDGLGAFARHKVDAHGRFKFTLMGSDESYLYVYDGSGDPIMTTRRVDRSEISQSMRIILPVAVKGNDTGIRYDSKMMER